VIGGPVNPSGQAGVQGPVGVTDPWATGQRAGAETVTGPGEVDLVECPRDWDRGISVAD
jgi:hypothetical protein